MWRVQAVTAEGSLFTNRLSLPERLGVGYVTRHWSAFPEFLVAPLSMQTASSGATPLTRALWPWQQKRSKRLRPETFFSSAAIAAASSRRGRS
ncbi:unnamed protein product [Polarella glacialis]|uniref:Uncharacterized protein n=1 Tax=Polarella glacialis TaxID=89957 RepID=A0A813E799_POLGL|nr:unnamed protein product [Polarella glacialis]